MLVRDLRFIQVFRRAVRFVAARPGLAALAGVATLVEALQGAAATFEHFAVEQKDALLRSRGETAQARAVRLRLRTRHMRIVVQSVRFIDRAGPVALFDVPSARARPDELLAAARSLAGMAAPYREQLVAAGFGGECLDALDAAIDELHQSIATRGEHRARLIAATEALHKAVADGKPALALLDTLLLAALEGNEPELVAWRSAIHPTRAPSTAHEARVEDGEAAEALPLLPIATAGSHHRGARIA